MTVNSSEQLYTIEYEPPRAIYIDVEEAQQELYPFLLSSLPAEMAAEAEASRLGRMPWGIREHLIPRGVNRVDWRQYPRKILQVQLVTVDIAEALLPLTNGRMYRGDAIEVSFAGNGYREYVYLQSAPRDEDPFFHCVDVSRTPELSDCEDWRAVSRRLRTLSRERVSVDVWLPRTIFDGPRVVCVRAVNSLSLVNDEFVRAWRSTDISKALREDPWEYDLHFEPFDMHAKRGHNLRYFDE